jgi:hypothetical protein
MDHIDLAGLIKEGTTHSYKTIFGDPRLYLSGSLGQVLVLIKN